MFRCVNIHLEPARSIPLAAADMSNTNLNLSQEQAVDPAHGQMYYFNTTLGMFHVTVRTHQLSHAPRRLISALEEGPTNAIDRRLSDDYQIEVSHV